MKKVFAIAFVAASFALVSCGGSTETTATVDSLAAVVDSAVVVADSAAVVADSAAVVADSAAAKVEEVKK